MMEMSESLEKLRNRILSDARLKADEIIREASQKADQIRNEAREKAEREASEILARAEAEAEAARRSIISSRIRANRLKLLEERNKIVQSVLADVEERLSTVATTGNFQEVVKRLATEAIDAIGSDRKSTRLNSSHLVISYAVFCLKKKKRPLASKRLLIRRVV